MHQKSKKNLISYQSVCMNMVTGNGLKILASISIIFLVIIVAYISRSLAAAMIFGILLAYMLYPIYRLALIKTGSEKRSSQIAISAVLVVSALILLVSYFIISQGTAGIPSDMLTERGVQG